ncbi:ABC transporter substrate-binding protein [Amycolatopsis thermoflava]|uniref:ABC transporter substrate-binding protein n=1 Tax=Amycolatopsis thermoflava TaxID=84480 RepID=UPI00042A2FFE|nr:ABC transporter substrate-binding protein [Amycolatopsis thermoflava]
MPIRIGAHPNNTSLAVFSRRPDTAEQLRASGVDAEFFPYNSGNQTIPLFRAGALDVGGTGSTPPLHALATGLDVVLLAATPPRPDRGGLVVLDGSPVRDVTDLAGRSVAVMPLSWHPQLLIAALTAAGMGWHDVTVVELNDATARDALLRGGIDAWIVTDPALADLERYAPVRVVTGVGEHHSNRSVIWSLRSVVDAAPDAIAAVLTALDASDRRIAADPAEAARLLTGTASADWTEVLARRSWGLTRPGDDFVTEQQRHADLLARAGVLPRPVDIAGAVRGPAFGKETTSWTSSGI